jgi:hypothetical protein
MGTEVGTYRNFVSGRWVEADAHFDDFNSFSGELVARADLAQDFQQGLSSGGN